MASKQIQFSVIFLTASILSNCGPLKKMDEMGENTASLLQQTGEMKSKMDSLNTKVEESYVDARSGETWKTRNEAFHNLIQADTMPGRLAAAAAYFNAFEFQLWRNESGDTLARRETLFKKAIAEFFRNVSALDNEDASDLNPKSDHPGTLALFALATALHTINDRQVELASAGGFQTKTMLDLIEQALENDKKIAQGELEYESQSDYLKEVQKFRKEALLLMQLRHGFLAAMCLPYLSEEVSGVVFGLLPKDWSMYLFKWDATVDGLSVAQLEYLTQLLEKSEHTRDFLKSIGRKAKLNSKLKEVFKNLRWSGESNRLSENRYLKTLKSQIKTLNSL